VARGWMRLLLLLPRRWRSSETGSRRGTVRFVAGQAVQTHALRLNRAPDLRKLLEYAGNHVLDDHAISALFRRAHELLQVLAERLISLLCPALCAAWHMFASAAIVLICFCFARDCEFRPCIVYCVLCTV
jgi:hypothetical protein